MLGSPDLGLLARYSDFADLGWPDYEDEGKVRNSDQEMSTGYLVREDGYA